MRRRLTSVLLGAALGVATAVALPTPALANWHPWTDLGGAALESGPGFAPGTSLYARDAGGKLVRAKAGGPAPVVWEPEHMYTLTAPSVITGRPKAGTSLNAEVYYTTSENDVNYLDSALRCSPPDYCRWGAQHGYTGGRSSAAPSATRLHGDRVDLFARSLDDHLTHSWHYGTIDQPWADWEQLGGLKFEESPSAVSWWSGNRLDVFVRGTDNGLWQLYWTSGGGWSEWEYLGGTIRSAPSVIAFDDGRLDVFARSTSNTLLHRWWGAGAGWSAWEDLGGSVNSAPTAVKTGDRRIDVYAVGGNGRLQHTWWG
ncbi:DUF346 domain-containing protein [Saccharothrix obliqua]|uniref:DUF346 domain-containing protein n=1 Tax=Saccharothrix obliqua TaxID=2861747 RepID=UPI001C5FAF14|nr:DUF346 domain-containing protein [Saccharothrix obliqua]MBW4720513.1 DUF346 domain-containing protein [Saccharothrix obliqua]